MIPAGDRKIANLLLQCTPRNKRVIANLFISATMHVGTASAFGNSVFVRCFSYERLHQVSADVRATRLIVQYVLVEAHHALLKLFLHSKFNTQRPNPKSLTGGYS